MMRNLKFTAAAAAAAFIVLVPDMAQAQRVAPVLKPTPLPGLVYDAEFFPGASHDPAVPTVESVLGFREGARAATTAEVKRCLDAWAAASPRVRVIEYARSHGGRPLHYVVITDPANLKRLDEIKAGFAKLADPRKLAGGEADKLVDSLPGVAWLAYTIHGDETEGTDAALAVIHHLAAARDKPTAALLRDLVVLIDPVENPDGRDRFLKMIAEARGVQPNVDDQSMVHTGYLPYGRTNHYGFDMNRDLLYGTQPETVGRWRVIQEWNPQLAVDSHGMGSQESFLFSPPRAPMNPYYPERYQHWAELFGREHGEAFDKQGWTYYTGEWNEGWYPGYMDTWPSIRGAVGILYEQARMSDDGVRRADGSIQSYREAVHGNVVSTMANLATFQRNAKEMRRDFHNHRLAALDPTGPFGSRSWAVLPSDNRGRLAAFASCLEQQGIEVLVLDGPLTVAKATDQFGRDREDVTLPAGTLIIPNKQPLGHLAALLLDFDPQIPEPSLKHEREELLKKGNSSIYDMTSWNLTMMHGLEALAIPAAIEGEGTTPFAATKTAARPAPLADSAVGWVADGADDASVVFAARLMEHGIRVRIADKAFEFDGAPNVRGSVIVSRRDNAADSANLATRIGLIAGECGVDARAIGSGFGKGDLPDLGGGHFRLLERPRVAVLTRGGVSTGDFGTVWHLLEQTLAIRNSQISDEDTGYDLRRYNVIIIPSYYGDGLKEAFAKDLRAWVDSGGTLIATGGSAGIFTTDKTAIGSTRKLPGALDEIEPFRQQVLREWLAAEGAMPDTAQLWARDVAAEVSYPWRTDDKDGPEAKELKRRDEWQKLFMPQGAILAGRVNTEHWLTAGAGAILPIVTADGPVLLAPSGVESPVRYGVFGAADGEEADGEEAKANAQPSFVGWSAMPPGRKLTLRMSGLLWPEAAQRIANSAYLTRESIGKGQIILFAGRPTFRAAALGTQRLMMNAIVAGPGIGTTGAIIP
ncbi:MAG TPA: M14 family metallopeptidase [Opitutaceae bacterium]|nr:M14 family metallopeptidase [Opitutaceae bacterium]